MDPNAHFCEKCEKGFGNVLALASHKIGKHGHEKVAICNGLFETRGKLGLHKIEVCGFTRKQLGLDLRGGWKKGMTQAEALNVTWHVNHHYAEFMNRLNTPDYMKINRLTRQYHKDVVLEKEKKFRAKGVPLLLYLKLRSSEYGSRYNCDLVRWEDHCS